MTTEELQEYWLEKVQEWDKTSDTAICRFAIHNFNNEHVKIANYLRQHGYLVEIDGQLNFVVWIDVKRKNRITILKQE